MYAHAERHKLGATRTRSEVEILEQIARDVGSIASIIRFLFVLWVIGVVILLIVTNQS